MQRTHDRWQTHPDSGHNWALVLAAGNGSRLQALTTTASGVAIPKQFCSIRGEGSLLHDALRRARAVADPKRICAIVADHHRRWWQSLPLGIPASNVISQPRNRGTANGILFPLLHIVHRDPEAMLLVLPSDHYVRNEDVLAGSLRAAMTELKRDRSHVILLGITPEDADPDFGYIVVDGDSLGGISAVSEFVEKPKGDGRWINGGFFVLEPAVFDYLSGDEDVWELDPMRRLTQEGQLAAYRHEGFWSAMDTLRDKTFLENLWASNRAPWKIWQ